MANIFSNVKLYDPSWQVKEVLQFSPEDIRNIKSAQVQVSKFGMSVCFTLVSGALAYIPLDSDETDVSEGEYLNVDEWVVKVLVKEGRQPIERVCRKGPDDL